MSNKPLKKKRPILMAGGFILLALFGLRLMTVRNHADTVKDQERILSRGGPAVTVLSSHVFQEDMVTHDIITEVRDETGGYGFAHFRRDQSGHFFLEEKSLSRGETPVVTGKLLIRDEEKAILMYDRSGIDHAVVTFSDDSTGAISPEVRVPFAGRYEIIEAPVIAGDWSIDVQFFDEDGELIPGTQ